MATCSYTKLVCTKRGSIHKLDTPRLWYYLYMGVVSKKIKTTDKIVRAKLIEDLCSSSKTLGIFEEFDVVRGRARADIVSVTRNGLHAYEIKSDVDTLARLPGQARHYNNAFSSVTLVVGGEHVIKSLYLIPEWWGVIVASYVDDELRLSNIREARNNTKTDFDIVSDLLQKKELVEILGKHSPGCSYSSMSKTRLIHETRKRLPQTKLFSSLSTALLSRNTYTFLSSEIRS